MRSIAQQTFVGLQKVLKASLNSHLHLHLGNIFTLKRSSTFANLLMEKPGNSFAIVKI